MKRASPILVAFVTVTIDLLGFGIVLPLLPVYADTFLLEQSELVRNAAIGGLMASFSLMQFLFAPGWGRLSDRIGRRPVLILGLSGSVVFYALFGYATVEQSLLLLYVSRIGAGICGATIGTAQAVIADSTPKEKRAHGMALIGMAFGFGFTLGPVIGALLASGENEPLSPWPGFVASGLSLAALLLAVFRLPETRPVGNLNRRPWFDLGGWRLALGNRPVALPLLTFFIATLAFASFESTIARFAKDVLFDRESLHLRMRHMGYLFAFIGAVLMVAQGGLVRPLLKRVGEVPMILMGVILMLVGLVMVAFVVDPQNVHLPLALTVMGLAVVGFAFLTPSAQALVSRRTSALRQGEVLGVNQAAASIARILGPLLGNMLYGSPASGHVMPYYAGGVLLALAFVIALAIPRRDSAQESPHLPPAAG